MKQISKENLRKLLEICFILMVLFLNYFCNKMHCVAENGYCRMASMNSGEKFQPKARPTDMRYTNCNLAISVLCPPKTF